MDGVVVVGATTTPGLRGRVPDAPCEAAAQLVEGPQEEDVPTGVAGYG